MTEAFAKALSHAPRYLLDSPNKPPFIAGQIAWHEGEALDANPHHDEPCAPDDYPGPHRSWAQGWKMADAKKK